MTHPLKFSKEPQSTASMSSSPTTKPPVKTNPSNPNSDSSAPSSAAASASSSKASSSSLPSSSSSSSSSQSSSGTSSPKVTSAATNHTGSANSTGTTGAIVGPSSDGGIEAGTVVAVFFTVVIILALIGVIYYYLKKKGKLRHLPGFRPIRQRRSSTSDSTRVLPDSDITDIPEMKSSRMGEQDDMFTIDDHEPQDEPRDEEYYYDVGFGQSDFEDERTKSSVRELYSTADGNDEEEVLDFDFETLGIKIEDYKIGDGGGGGGGRSGAV